MRFELSAGAICLDFANTIHNSRAVDNGEELHAISDLLQWGKEVGLLTLGEHDRLALHYKRNPRKAAADLAKGIAIRDLLLSTFADVANGRSVSSRRLSELNSALEQAPALLRVRKNSDGLETKWTSVADGLQQVLFAVLNSAAELLASDRLGRVRQCGSPVCTWLFVDESRNHSRRWCDMSACGNRMKARRYYQRSKTAAQ